MEQYKAYLIVRRLKNGEEVHRVGLQNISEINVDWVMRGMIINMDTDRFYIDDSEVDAARIAAAKEAE